MRQVWRFPETSGGSIYPVGRKRDGVSVLPLSQGSSDDAPGGGRAITINTGILVGIIQGHQLLYCRGVPRYLDGYNRGYPGPTRV